MAKKPTPKAKPTKSAKPAVAFTGQRFDMTKVPLAQRIPKAILDALDARVAREKIGSRNHGFILAAMAWGDLTDETRAAMLAQLDAEPVSIASKIGAPLTPATSAPGSRLDKLSIGKRHEAKPKPGKKPPAPAVKDDDEVIV
jgi:hypothetical protein